MQQFGSSDLLYGTGLFQDDASLQRLLNERNIKAGLSLTIGIIAVILSFFYGIPNSNEELAILVIGIGMLIFGAMIGKQKFRPFMIYEHGILCNFPKIPFMRFQDINHISIWNWAKPVDNMVNTSGKKEPGGRILIIYMKSGQKYAVAEFGMGRLDPHRFLLASEIILKRLKETHPNEPESNFIQNYAR